jgi:hypothetical protein
MDLIFEMIAGIVDFFVERRERKKKRKELQD